MNKINLRIKFNKSDEIDPLDKKAYICDLFEVFSALIENPIIEEVNFYEI